MKPTPRALALLEPIKAVLNEIEQILLTPEVFSPIDSQKRFVIATSDYIEFTLLPPLMVALNVRAPKIEIHVKQVTNKLPEAAIEENKIDLIIGFDAAIDSPSHMCKKYLFDDRIVCILRQDHDKIYGDQISFDQFIASEHMLISRRGTGTGLVDDWLDKQGLTRKISLIVPNFLSAPWIVANTNLVLSIPLRLAEKFVLFAPLKIVPLPIDIPTYEVIMLWHPLQEKDPSLQWLRQEILEVCNKMTG